WGGWLEALNRRLAGDGKIADDLARVVDGAAGEDPGAGLAGDDGGGQVAEVQLGRVDRDDRPVGRDEVRADPQRHDDLGGGEDGQGDGHGGHGTAGEGAGGG